MAKNRLTKNFPRLTSMIKMKRIECAKNENDRKDIKDVLKSVVRKFGVGVKGFAALVGSDQPGISQCLKGAFKPCKSLLITLLETMYDIRTFDKEIFNYCLKNEMLQLKKYLDGSIIMMRRIKDE